MTFFSKETGTSSLELNFNTTCMTTLRLRNAAAFVKLHLWVIKFHFRPKKVFVSKLLVILFNFFWLKIIEESN